MRGLSSGTSRRGAFGDRLKARFTRSTSCLAVLLPLMAAAPAMAQDGAIVIPGDLAVTGFSGIKFPAEGLPPGIDPVDETFIDPDGVSLRIFHVQNMGGPAAGQVVYPPPPFEVKARQIGQVFGLAYDDGIREGRTDQVPNLYVTAGVMHGLQAVVPDADGDGRPERIKIGQAGATFMEGQHGMELGGGPGAIYRVDGLTGQVTLFASVAPGGVANSGPGLGNIAFDARNRQLFVSDLDTGLIHRFDLAGNDLGQFDHGISGRPAHGLAALPDDGARMDITNAAFDSGNPETWGFTAPGRRIHGLAVSGNRLFYAVLEGLQIWSVGINLDGSFAGDAHWELDVAADQPYPVTDMVFDRDGYLYLAQRGTQRNDYDYTSFAEPQKAQVLRYHREQPDDPATASVWVAVPAEHAVGFPVDHRMTTGGLDLEYGYDEDGTFRSGTCEQTLVVTGDDLRNNPDLAAQLAVGGPLDVHGVQLTDKRLMRPENTPPWRSYFVDYDNLFDDPELRGHVGDVEVWRPCNGRVGYDVPGGIPPVTFPNPTPCINVKEVWYGCSLGGQYIAEVYLDETVGIGTDSLKASSLKPGVIVNPVMQSRPNAAFPFDLEFGGALPGETVNVDVCVYNSADAAKGGAFPCCQATVKFKMPAETCAP